MATNIPPAEPILVRFLSLIPVVLAD